MSPIFVELSKKYPTLVFLKVDVDEVAVSVFPGIAQFPLFRLLIIWIKPIRVRFLLGDFLGSCPDMIYQGAPIMRMNLLFSKRE
jgi:hypothetical protein